LHKAIGYYERQLAIAREIEDRQGEGNALGNLGIAYAALGETEKANALLEQALQIGQAIKNIEIIRGATAGLAACAAGRRDGPALFEPCRAPPPAATPDQ